MVVDFSVQAIATQTLTLSNSFNTSNFVIVIFRIPLTRIEWLTTMASNQPHLLGLPVVAPYSPPSDEFSPRLVFKLRWKGTFSDAGGVGFCHTDHRVDHGRTDSRACTGI